MNLVAPSLRRSLTVAAWITAGWLVVRLWLAFHQPIPLPQIHDEFGYLLGADTFAHGRLTNPPHALPHFFESPHILISPTYAPKYVPGSSFFLATGQVLFGSPIWGVVLEGAAMMFALSLMLTTWVRMRWAVALAVVTGLYMQPPMYWQYSYWGGCVAATGAAVVLFGVGRHLASRQAAYAAVVALGWAILFWTRPYEGGVFSLAVLVLWVWNLRREMDGVQLGRIAAWAAPVVICAALWTGYYDRAVTGNALQLPYLLHEERYMTQPIFWFQPLRTQPELDNVRLVALHGSHGAEANAWRGSNGSIKRHINHVWPLCVALAAASGPACLLLLLVPVAWRDKRVRMMSGVVATGAVALYLLVYSFGHYAAPFGPVVVLIAACATEVIAARGLRKLAIGGVIVAACAGIAYNVVKWRLPNEPYLVFSKPRQTLIAALSNRSRPQLVFVRYQNPAQDVRYEWVFNSAEIDEQRVVFAFDLGLDKDSELERYFAGREAWLVTVEGHGHYRMERINRDLRYAQAPGVHVSRLESPARDRQTSR